jgi:hypothetical protein
MDCIGRAQYWDQWYAFVNTAMKLRVRKVLRIPGVSAKLAASREGLNPTQLVIEDNVPV